MKSLLKILPIFLIGLISGLTPTRSKALYRPILAFP